MASPDRVRCGAPPPRAVSSDSDAQVVTMRETAARHATGDDRAGASLKAINMPFPRKDGQFVDGMITMRRLSLSPAP